MMMVVVAAARREESLVSRVENLGFCGVGSAPVEPIEPHGGRGVGHERETLEKNASERPEVVL